jgi:hypothetical protein
MRLWTRSSLWVVSIKGFYDLGDEIPCIVIAETLYQYLLTVQGESCTMVDVSYILKNWTLAQRAIRICPPLSAHFGPGTQYTAITLR